MLPNYQKTKDKLNKFYIERMLGGKYDLPIQSKKLFEGDKSVMIRENGEIDETEFKQIGATISVSYEEYENLTFPEIVERIDEKAKEMSLKKTEFMFDKINEAVSEIGNVVDCKNDFNVEHLLELIDKMHIEFDENGKPIFPIFIPGSKDVLEKFQIVLTQIDSVPKYKKAMKDLLEKKKLQYNDRENNRKLVG
ncbi:MAG: hypothetical protein JST15_07875 [Bacteroidetes bacterium]|nr:hypothetical protein [Bacteroidota bacterium]